MPDIDPKAVEEDLRLQADPALKLSEGWPTWGAIVVTTLAVLAVVGTVFYA